MNCKNKSFMTKKKAFTLIELLIVIAIIGILFIVLVSKVDFATDKANESGVQTDFRSFQLAFDTVAIEHDGFSELVDTDYEKLEAAINKNLDNALKIDIDADGKITMTNGTTDPWKVPYHGAYISGTDGRDRGCIVMYSNGPNMQFGSDITLTGGVASVNVINDAGKDDYSLISCYSLVNGYGAVQNITTGFSSNQSITGTENNTQGTVPGNGSNNGNEDNGGNEDGGDDVVTNISAGLYAAGSDYSSPLKTWKELLDDGIIVVESGTVTTHFDAGTYSNTSSAALEGELVLPSDGSITSIGYCGFTFCDKLVTVVIPNSVTSIGDGAFMYCLAMQSLSLPNSIENIGEGALSWCGIRDIVLPNNLTQMSDSMFAYSALESITIPNNVTKIGEYALDHCTNLKTLIFKGNVNQWNLIEKGHVWQGVHDPGENTGIQAEYVQCIDGLFYYGVNGIAVRLKDDGTYFTSGMYDTVSQTLIIPSTVNGIAVTKIGNELFWARPTSITIPNTITSITEHAFSQCTLLESIIFEGTKEEWKAINFSGNFDDVPATYIQCSDGRILLDGSEYHEECEVVIQDIDCNGPYNVRYYVYENNVLVERTASISAGSGITIYAAAETDIYIDTNNAIGVYNRDYDYDQSINKYNYADDGVYVTVPVMGYCIIDIFS